MNDLHFCPVTNTHTGFPEKKSVVVTFVWQELNPREQRTLQQGVDVLGRHPFVVLHPESFNIEALKKEYGNVIFLALPDKHFHSIDAYNEMLLSTWFYDIFAEYEYMLIYQTDAYVFSDQLNYWTSMGFDYIGAPWMLNDNVYQRYLGQWVKRLLKCLPIHHHHVHSAHLFHQVGNGGFSLRRIPKMREIMEKNKALIKSVSGKHARQEDVMISILLKEKENLKIPSWRLAIYFSWEKSPAQCLELTGGVFPFGCHDTNGKYWERFWKYYIPLEE